MNINRLLDIEMDVTVRFGVTEMPLQEIVNFGTGSMIELNRSVDDPVELLVNNFPFARGEVVVIDGYYSIKITELDLPDKNSSNPFINSSAENSIHQPPAHSQPNQAAPQTANQPFNQAQQANQAQQPNQSQQPVQPQAAAKPSENPPAQAAQTKPPQRQPVQPNQAPAAKNNPAPPAPQDAPENKQ